MYQASLTKYWWNVALRGLLAVGFGLFALTWTGLTVWVLVVMFGAYAVTAGLFSVVAGFMSMSENRQWWVFALEGMVGVVVGVMVFAWPAVTGLVLLYLIAIWAIVRGFVDLSTALTVPLETGSRVLLGIAGLLSMGLGILLIIFPTGGAIAIAWLIGVFAVAIGITMVALGFELRHLKPGL